MDVHDVQQFESAGDVEALAGALAEADPRVRRQACYALGQLGRTATVEALVRLLDADSEPAVRAAAAEALGWMRAPGAAAQLIRALQNDVDADVRARAAAALGAIGDRSALPALEEAARAGLAPSAAGHPDEASLEAVLALGRFLPDLATAAVLRELALDEGETGRLARQALLPEIVWETYYQESLRHLAADARWGTSGWTVAAELRADPGNPYDEDAVAVVAVAMGKTVGYLRNDSAPAFAATLRREGAIPCTIEIRGSRRLSARLVSLESGPSADDVETAAAPDASALRDEALALLAACVSEEMTVVCLERLGDVSDARDAARVATYAKDRRPGVRSAALRVLRAWGSGLG